MLTIDGVEMLDIREAAEIANRSPETIRRWVWSSRLTANRRGNRLLVARHDVEQLAGFAAEHPERTHTLGEWAAQVREERRLGRLGEPGSHRTAADLVLSDRAERDAG